MWGCRLESPPCEGHWRWGQGWATLQADTPLLPRTRGLTPKYSEHGARGWVRLESPWSPAPCRQGHGAEAGGRGLCHSVSV